MGREAVIHPLNFFFGKPINKIEQAANHARNAYYSEYLKRVEAGGMLKNL